jgi:3-hydroxyacyl-[acyl-carrier-protein] dehydratase
MRTVESSAAHAPRRISRWTTIDAVTALEPGKRATGIRNVPNTLSILDSHFPRFPVLPGVLILGSMGELAAHLLEDETGKAWRLAGAEHVRFRHFVQPGDTMELTVEIKERAPDSAVLTASAQVAGKAVTSVRRLHMAPRAGDTG